MPIDAAMDLTRRRVLTGGFAVALLSWPLTACALTTDRLRCTLTIEVDTPAGPRTGHSVVEVLRWWDLARPQIRLRGEAAAVDLPGGQTLFALLSNPHHPEHLLHGIGERLVGPVIDAQFQAGIMPPDHGAAFETLREAQTVAPLDAEWEPYLVRFRDPRRPESILPVQSNNLTGAFGRGTALRGITVQATDAKLTDGIVDRLPWLEGHSGTMVPSRTLRRDGLLQNPALALNEHAFKVSSVNILG